MPPVQWQRGKVVTRDRSPVQTNKSGGGATSSSPVREAGDLGTSPRAEKHGVKRRVPLLF